MLLPWRRRRSSLSVGKAELGARFRRLEVVDDLEDVGLGSTDELVELIIVPFDRVFRAWPLCLEMVPNLVRKDRREIKLEEVRKEVVELSVLARAYGEYLLQKVVDLRLRYQRQAEYLAEPGVDGDVVLVCIAQA